MRYDRSLLAISLTNYDLLLVILDLLLAIRLLNILHAISARDFCTRFLHAGVELSEFYCSWFLDYHMWFWHRLLLTISCAHGSSLWPNDRDCDLGSWLLLAIDLDSRFFLWFLGSSCNSDSVWLFTISLSAIMLILHFAERPQNYFLNCDCFGAWLLCNLGFRNCHRSRDFCL